MKLKLIISILITFSLQQFSLGQSETYTIKKALFSSDKYDEFSPVYYKNGIVFCTNRNNSLSDYSTLQNKGSLRLVLLILQVNQIGKAPGYFQKTLSQN